MESRVSHEACVESATTLFYNENNNHQKKDGRLSPIGLEYNLQLITETTALYIIFFINAHQQEFNFMVSSLTRSLKASFLDIEKYFMVHARCIRISYIMKM